VTKAKRAWRNGMRCVRSGQHTKAIYWLSRTVAILDSDPPTWSPQPATHVVGYVIAAVLILSVWITAR
jgi:protein-S-isoprenylcysteine O-methyltransferase Ste14